jgi:hypothetical protein
MGRMHQAMRTMKPADTIVVRNELGRSFAKAIAVGLDMADPHVEVRDKAATKC